MPRSQNSYGHHFSLMKKKLTKAEVQAELRDKSESMTRHVNGLEAEAVAAQADAQTAVKDAFFSNPWLGVGGAALGGLALGLLFGGLRKRRARKRLASAHGALVEQYLDAVQRDVRRAVRSGDDTHTAVYRALHDRVPLVIYNPEPEEGEERGTFRQALDLIIKTGFSLLVKYVLDEAIAGQVDRYRGDNLTDDLAENAADETVADDLTVAGAVVTADES